MLQKGNHLGFDKNILFTYIDRLRISLYNEVKWLVFYRQNKSKIGLISQDGGYLGKIG